MIKDDGRQICESTFKNVTFITPFYSDSICKYNSKYQYATVWSQWRATGLFFFIRGYPILEKLSESYFNIFFLYFVLLTTNFYTPSWELSEQRIKSSNLRNFKPFDCSYSVPCIMHSYIPLGQLCVGLNTTIWPSSAEAFKMNGRWTYFFKSPFGYQHADISCLAILCNSLEIIPG
jgi:hypothetical protein